MDLWVIFINNDTGREDIHYSNAFKRIQHITEVRSRFTLNPRFHTLGVF